MRDQLAPALIVIAGLSLFAVTHRLARTGRLRGHLFGSKVLESLGQVDAQGGVFDTVVLRVHRLAAQHDGACVGLDITVQQLGGVTVVPVCLPREQASSLHGLLRQALRHEPEPYRVGPESLQQEGQVAGRVTLSTASLRVSRLALPDGGVNVVLETTLKSILSFDIQTARLTREQATHLAELLASAVSGSA